MALETFTESNIQFEKTFISSDELDQLLNKITPDLSGDEEETPSPFLLKPAASYADARDQVKLMLENGGLIEDVLGDRFGTADEINIDDVLAEMDRDLAPSVETGHLPPEILAQVEEWKGFATFDDDGETAVLRIDGQDVMTIGPFMGAKSKNAKVTAATIVVIIDVVLLILAVATVKVAKNRKTKEAMGEAAKKSIGAWKTLIKELLRNLSGPIARIRDRDEPKKDVVLELMDAIADAIKSAMSRLWKHMWRDFKKVLKALFSSGKQIICAVASITATVLLAIGTAGAALAASYINLALTIVGLIDDCIKLKAAMAA